MMLKRLPSLNIGWLLILYALLAVAFSVTTPIFETPDELQHVYYIEYLARTHTLPRLQPGAVEEEAPYAQEAGQPPLYYALGALIVRPIDWGDSAPERNPHANVGNPMQLGNKNIVIHTPDEGWPWQGMPLAVHLLRFFSIVLGAGTVFFVWKIADGLFADRPGFALATAALVAFLPQFLFISAAVTNDNLIIFLSTFILWLLLYWFGPALQRTPEWIEALLLGMFLGFAVLSKLSGLYLWGVVALAYLIHAWTRRAWGDAIPAALLTFFAATALATPWFLRNWNLYGDPTALRPFLAIVGPRETPIHPRSEFQGLRISLLGLFGWFNIPLPAWIYRLWDTFLALAAIGVLQGVWRRRFALRPLRRYAYLLLLAVWLLLLFLALIRWTSMTPGTQGRLLFPALASLSIWIMLGWREWLPQKQAWLALPPMALFLLSLYSVAWVIPSAYAYPSLVTPDDVPQEARRPPITYDGRIQLVGALAQPTTVRPGDTFELTLYWRKMDMVPYNASLFIHVLGRDFEDVAQINTYPGWGNAPTQYWPLDQVLVDRYLVTLPGRMETPTKLLVDVGLYDYESKQPYPAILDSNGSPPLGLLVLRALPSSSPAYKIAHPTDFYVDNLLQLAGYELAAMSYRPGDTLSLGLFWRALSPIADDYQVFVHVVNAAGERVAGFDKTPLDGWWPTTMWEPGQLVNDEIAVPLPGDLPAGEYELRVGLYRLSDLQRLPLTGDVGKVIDSAAILTKVTIQP